MKDNIINILEGNNVSLTIMEINDKLGLTTIEEYQELLSNLDELISDGIVYYSERKKKYLLLENSHLVRGKFISNDKGFGFINVSRDVKDVYVNKRNILDAMDGDIVLFEYLNKDENYPEGRVIKILKRNCEPLVGEVIFENGEYYVDPDRKGKNIYIPREYLNGAVEGSKVVVEPTVGSKRTGKITKIIGHKNDVGIDILSFVYEYNFNPTFPEELKDEIEEIPSFLDQSVIEDELKKGRLDLRNKKVYTIDGIDTKDIDDAISLTKDNDSLYHLGVHIADVSYYVKEGTLIDKEAYTRGTSVYLVDRVLPMLPHKLSNGICSLNENEDRFAMTCDITIDSKGNTVKSFVYPSIIRSKKKMDYDSVNMIIEENKVPVGYEEYKDDILLMEELSKILRKKMIRRGYIEFESTEANIIVDDACHPIEIKKRSQRSGEEIIENFMIIANEEVASSIFYKDLPGIYRIHDKPNEKRLEEFLKFLSLRGYTATGSKIKTSKDLQNILNQISEGDNTQVLHDMAIRCQAKAKYSPDNIGHFGLGSKCYSHFTAPIRRYPDLILHRLVRDYNFNYSDEVIENNKLKIPVMAEHCSLKEMEAQNCERDVDKMKKAEYMMDHIGEIYEGIISSVQEFGLFVELDNTCEGLIKPETIKGDYFVYDKDLIALVGKRTNKRYGLGDKVTIKVVAANKEKSQIDFEIYDKNCKENNNSRVNFDSNSGNRFHKINRSDRENNNRKNHFYNNKNNK